MNIVYRTFEYLANTMYEYRTKKKLDVYSTKPLELPKPEIYVVYVGEKEAVITSDISLRRDVYKDETVQMDIVAKVIYKGNKDTLMGQYILFSHVFNRQRVECETLDEAIRNTIKICKDDGILKDYLIKHETEVVTMMEGLYDQDLIIENYVASQIREAKAETEAIKINEVVSIIKVAREYGASLDAAITTASDKTDFSIEEVKEIWNNKQY